MRGLEQILALFVAAVVLSAAARHGGAPHPVFSQLAILSMRTNAEIGDHAFDKLEEELDQLEIAVRRDAK
jgi:hypothetical protein